VAVDGWLPGATCSLVLTGRRGDQEVVLRTPVTPWEIEASLPALLAFAGRGGVEILASDSESGTTLMPRLRPGHTLAEVPEEEAVEAAGALMLRMRGTAGSGPTVCEYLQPTLEASPLPSSLRPDLAENAARLAQHLLDTSPPPAMLHGDLHHFNVLRQGSDWVAIDPEGMVGDPAYECAAFLRNPVPELADDPDLVDRLRRRILRFSGMLGDAPERIWGWGLVRTAQTVSWSDVSPFHAPWTKGLAALDVLWPEFAPLL
jgi:streptomycin 6-kinase